jgi:hypothetical protein
MTITTTTITKIAGWARTDVIDQLEQAFTWLGLHGTPISGLVTSISSYSGGGTVGSANTNYYDIPVFTTSGIGTGATFNVDRQGGNVFNIYVNRPGVGYTQGEFVTLSAEDIGGAANGAVAIGITVNIDPIGYGSTNQFFDKNFSPSDDSGRPWGVLKQDFDTNKRFGVTYRAFKAYDDYRLAFYVGSSFFPFNTSNTVNGGGYYANSFRGTPYLDVAELDPIVGQGGRLDGNYDNYAQVSATQDGFQYATSNSPTTHDLKLNIYRSGIDPSFAVLSYNQPSISGTLNDSTFSTFIIHNFNSNLWNLDEVFSAGITFIDKDPSINLSGGDTGFIGFKTILVGNHFFNGINNATRTAESGWSQSFDRSNKYASPFKQYTITSSQSNYSNSDVYNINNYETLAHSASSHSSIYSRSNGFKDTGVLEGDANLGTYRYGNRYPITSYNSVIKGIPINGNLIPCPYYMPDDFVLIDFKLTASGQDLKQGDTITISGSEVYTVITGSYNKFGETAGILFCARTV